MFLFLISLHSCAEYTILRPSTLRPWLWIGFSSTIRVAGLIVAILLVDMRLLVIDGSFRFSPLFLRPSDYFLDLIEREAISIFNLN